MSEVSLGRCVALRDQRPPIAVDAPPSRGAPLPLLNPPFVPLALAVLFLVGLLVVLLLNPVA
jgi:hypothetical protein